MGWSEVQHVECQARFGVRDAQVCGPLVRCGEEPTDPPRDGVLGERRLRELTELLQGRLLVLQAESPGLAQVIRDGDAIGAMLTRLGAHDAVMVWEERRMRREVRGTANRLANFDDANLRRSARAAVAAGARVERAFEILGDDIPDHLRQAGTLRLEHKQASLEELGQLADPPLTKDAVAGRIRRLLATADKRADDLGIPDTEAALTLDMLDVRPGHPLDERPAATRCPPV